MPDVSPELVWWLVSRASALAAYCALCIAMLSGIALRTSVLDFLATNRALRSLHDFTIWIWIPLAAAHVGALLLDPIAQVGVVDVVVPFRMPYGTLPIGLGTAALDLVVVIAVTGWVRLRMDASLWRVIHRVSYVAFVALFLHAFLSGTDFDTPLISALSWSAAAGIALLAASRILLGRLPE